MASTRTEHSPRGSIPAFFPHLRRPRAERAPLVLSAAIESSSITFPRYGFFFIFALPARPLLPASLPGVRIAEDNSFDSRASRECVSRPRRRDRLPSRLSCQVFGEPSDAGQRHYRCVVLVGRCRFRSGPRWQEAAGRSPPPLHGPGLAIR